MAFRESIILVARPRNNKHQNSELIPFAIKYNLKSVSKNNCSTITTIAKKAIDRRGLFRAINGKIF